MPSTHTPPTNPDLLDRYSVAGTGRRFLTGIHALTRLPIDQVRRDRSVGFNTSAFISGYPGSPLAGVDSELARHRALLDELGIVHLPAVNEELAMTALMGTQQVGEWPTRRVDGVSGWWYGKAPGLERALDALHHANTAGASASGGAVLFVGDDPAAKSSTVPSRSWGLLADLAVPVLCPGSSQDIIDLGRHAVALSRASGLYVALQIVTPVADGSGDVELGWDRFRSVIEPMTFHGERWTAHCEPRLLSSISLGLETEMVQARLPAARRYIADNGLCRRVVDPVDARVAVVAAGHTFRVVRDALDALGLDDARLGATGVRLVCLGAVWPLDDAMLRDLLGGVAEVIVVEDKRPFVETIVRDALYAAADRPVVSGKRAPDGAPLIPADGWLTVDRLLRPLADRLIPLIGAELLDLRLLQRLERPRIEMLTDVAGDVPARSSWYCSGCPHTTSTRSPAGAVVGIGTGCHAMAIITQPDIPTFGIAQMGGEGAAWFGVSPFVDTPHAFQNLGDGTLAHSGESAVRGAVAAGVNLTYKLLWNRAVAMTGGQAPVGGNDVATVIRRLLDEGVARIIVTTENTRQYRRVELPAGVEVWPRSRIIEAQELLAGVAGVTVLLHDQECAAELRRKRKRGRAPQAPRRTIIAERVCEGCGDCGARSSCLSVVPIDTEWGRRTAIHQTSCNQDESCIAGDCPSFVTVAGGDRTGTVTSAAPSTVGPDGGDLVEPEPVVAFDDVTVRIPGIGGTGVVTVSQIIGAAAGHAGRHLVTLDHTGLSQKAGPVVSDVRFSDRPITGSNVAGAGSVACYLVFDGLVALAPANLAGCDRSLTVAVVSESTTPTGRMIVDPSVTQPEPAVLRSALRAVSRDATFVDSESIVTGLLGDSAATNLFTLGVAFQRGAIPLPAASLEWAIEANGVAVSSNLAAFRWGRRWVIDPGSVPGGSGVGTIREDPIEMRRRDLVGYGQRRYVERWEALVGRVRRAEDRRLGGDRRLSTAVAEEFHRLLAVKDEYEVARLMLRPEVRVAALDAGGAGGRLTYHLHPPTLRAMGMGRKLAIDERLAVPMFRVLRAARRVRGTPLDVFGRTAHRRLERQLADSFERLVDHVIGEVDPDRVVAAIETVRLVGDVRGYESVKEASIDRYRRELQARDLGAFAP